MNLAEKTVKRNLLYDGKIIKLRVDDAVLPDGRPCKREFVEHPGGAAMLFVKDGAVLLVRQYRYAYGEALLEIPAGKLDAGEDPAAAAARELEEETGFRAEKTEHMFTLYPTPGYTNEKIYIYRAYAAESVGARPDDGEFVDSLFLPLGEAKKKIDSGEIRDAKTVVAITAYLLGKADRERKKNR